ncbi:MAG: TonB-dependent receptor [Gammaproteobacteria bacterium]|nr:TonB-dependent receptor [Gammaproteobacteria bacterium]
MFKRSVCGITSAAAILSVPFFALVPQLGYSQQVEEIVVSVRRKNESLQEVPLSVSTIGEEEIQRYGINTTADVVKYTAGLEFDEGLGAQDTRIVIRGLSPTRGRSNVAILVDGVDFTGEAVGTAGGGILVNQQLLDLERVEVVKGPQSALYGRSAFAGAIQYISKKPSLEAPEGSINVQVGLAEDNTEGMRVSGAFGAPVTDSFALRVNGLAYDQDGFYENSLTGSEVGGSEGYGVALGGLWDRGGMFTASGRIAASRDKYQPQAQARLLPNTIVDIDDSVAVQNGQSPSLIYTSGLGYNAGYGSPDCVPGTAGAFAERSLAIQGCGSTPKTIYAGTVPDAKGIKVVQNEDPRTGGGYEGTEVETVTSTLKLDWDTNAGLITSYTGFAGLDSTQRFDSQYDALPAGSYTNLAGDYSFTLADCGFLNCSPSAQELDLDNETRLFSQELRYSSQFDGPVNFTVGGLLWKEKVKQTAQSSTIAPLVVREGFGGGLFPPLTPPPPGPPPIQSIPAANLNLASVNSPSDSITRRDTTSYSLYGLIDWSISDTLGLELEGRWVSEKLNVTGDTCDFAATFALTGQGNGVDTCGNSFRGASSVVISDGGSLPDGTYTKAVFSSASAEFKDDFFAPKATLTWMPSDTQLVYGSVAQGIKPGGISTITAGAFFNPDANTFSKEKLLTYEIGSKSTLFDGSVLNAAVFFQQYTDKQVGVTRYDPVIDSDVGGIENAGEAETYGLELEGMWQITDYLSVGGAYTYLQSEYTKFTQQTQSGTNVARNLVAGGGGCLEVIPGPPATGPFAPGGIGTCIVDLAGNDIEDVPTHSFVGNTRWQSPLLSTQLDWYADASIIYKDKRFIDEFNIKELDSYWLLDVRTGLIGDRWEAILFVDNLLDDDTVKSALDFGSIVDSNRQGFFPPSPPDGIIVSMPDPRVIGVRLNFNFGG